MVSCIVCGAKDTELWVDTGKSLQCWDCAVSVVRRGGAFEVLSRAVNGRPVLRPEAAPEDLIAEHAGGGSGDGPKPLVRPTCNTRRTN
jgi:hypothetical protein